MPLLLDVPPGVREWRDISEEVNTMEKDKLSKCRAEVIERFINVEWIINAIISQHYFKKVVKPFVLEVLYDEYFSFGLKRRILKKVIENIDSKKVQELNRLNTIRNYFAHCNQEIFEISDIEVKDGKVIEKAKGKVIDPRNIEKEVNFESMYSEFMKMVGGVEEYLAKVYQDLGGELLKG